MGYQLPPVPDPDLVYWRRVTLITLIFLSVWLLTLVVVISQKLVSETVVVIAWPVTGVIYFIIVSISTFRHNRRLFGD